LKPVFISPGPGLPALPARRRSPIKIVNEHSREDSSGGLVRIGRIVPAKGNAPRARLQDGTMTADSMIVVIGTVAGFCTTFAYVPQVVKIWKQGGRDLSYTMLSLYLLGVCLWLAYGLLIQAQAVVITNLATAVLIAIATGLKAWTAKRDEVKPTLDPAASTAPQRS
jgi:MtN3 and saliva related transmembrane protein